LPNVPGFIFDLAVGEAEWGQARCGVALEAEGVAGLGGRGAVVAPAIGLDDEAEVGPEEVDLEFVDELFGERGRETGGRGDRAEEEFQLVVGEPKGVLVEDRAEMADARLAGRSSRARRRESASITNRLGKGGCSGGW